MPAPSPKLIIASPPSLNPDRAWPYVLAPLPAAALFGTPLASLAPRGGPTEPAANPNRKEPQ